MTDFATLGTRFVTEGADQTIQKLDQYQQKAGGAQKASDNMAGGTRRASDAIVKLLQSMDATLKMIAQAEAAQRGLATATGTTASAIQQEVAAVTQQAAAVQRASTANTAFSHSFTQVITSAGQADRALENIVGSAGGAGMAIDRAGDQARSAAMGFDTFYDQASRDFSAQWVAAGNRTIGVNDKLIASNRAVQAVTLNMTRQFADVFTMAVAGANPLMVLAMQGPQVADGFQVAAGAGLSFKEVLRGVYAQIAPLVPLLAAAGVVAGGMFAGLAIATKEINDQNKGLIDTLGLTDEQLKRVKNTSITMGDVMTGVWRATGQAFTDAFGPQIDAVQGFFSRFYDWLVASGVDAMKTYVGLYGGAFGALKAIWDNFPAIIQDAAISAANFAIRATNTLVQGAVDKINQLRPAINGFLAIMNSPFSLPELSFDKIDELKNDYAGAGQAVGEAWNKGYADAVAGLEDFGRSVLAHTKEAWGERIREQAGEAAKGQEGAARATKQHADELERLLGVLRQVEERLGGPVVAATRRFAQETDALRTLMLAGELPYQQWIKLNDALRGELDLTVTGVREVAQSFEEIEVPNLIEKQVEQLDHFIDALSDVDREVLRAADGMEEAFGRVGGAIGDVAVILSGYGIEASEISKKLIAEDISKAEAARRMGELQVRTYGDMAASAKYFFDEGTAGYKALQAVEMAYRAVQFANAIKAMVMDKTETGQSVIQSGIRAAAHGVEAVAKALASLPFPFNLAAGAATMAALVAVGVKMAGSIGGGGNGASLPSSEERQEAQGTGSVLGDLGAKSESLTRALEIAASNTNKMLEYENEQLKSLRAIEAGIGAMAAGLARELSIGGALDTSGLGLGVKASGNFIFGGSRSTTLNDQGIELVAATVGQIIADGVVGHTYQEIVEQTKKKLFGFTISNKTDVDTITGALSGDLAGQIQGIVGSLRGGILAAASILGVEGAAATLDAFNVDLGKLSFKDMTGAEIEAELNAIFGKLGDDMAAAALPFLADLQKVGEGAFETLQRVARQYTVMNVALESIGMAFDGVGVASLKARERLVDLSGGIDALAEQAEFFGENFLTEAERIAPIQAAVNREFERLGIVGINTADQFKQLVQSLDVSTESGATVYAALMRLAPAFLKVSEYTDGLNNELGTLATTSVQAAAQLAQANSLVESSFEALKSAYQSEKSRLTSLVASTGTDLENARQAVSDAYTARADQMQADVDAAAQAVEQARGVLEQALQAEADAARAAMQQAADAAGQVLSQAQQAAQAAAEAVKQAITSELAGLQSALDAATANTASARDVLRGAYDRERSAIEATIQEIDGLTESLTSFLADVRKESLALQGPTALYGAARSSFLTLAPKAMGGDMDAIRDLQGSAEAFREASLATSRTSLDYQRDLARIQSAVGGSLNALSAGKSVAEQQLDALKDQVRGLIDIDESVVSVQQAVWQVRNAIADEAVAREALEARKAETDALLTSLGLNEAAILSVADAVAQLQTAEAAEAVAQAQVDALQAGLAATERATEASVSVAEAAAKLQTAEQALTEAQATRDAFVNSADYLANVIVDKTDPIQQALTALETAEQAHELAVAQLAQLEAQVKGIDGLNDTAQTIADLVASYRTALDAQIAAQNTLNSLVQQEGAAIVAAIHSAKAFVPPAPAANDNTGGAAGQTNWDSYLSHYPDVLAEYNRLLPTIDWNSPWAAEHGFVQGAGPKPFAQWHYEHVGKAEGRTPYALGGAFDGPVTDILTRATQLGVGIGGEGGPEAIVPLQRGPDGYLGVRAMGAANDEAAAEIRALRAENARMQAMMERALAKIESNTAKTERVLTRVTRDGDSMLTEAA